MKISGRNVIDAAPSDVWAAINDPAVLARTLPGCSSLEVVDDGVFRATVTAGVASVRGTYTGTVELSDRVEPESLTLAAQGAGSAGTIGADVDVALADADGATAITWDAEAIVGGMIGGVGQRMLAGVSRRMADEFFANLERDIVTGPDELAASSVADEGGEVPGADAGTDRQGDGVAATAGTVFPGTASRAGASGQVVIDDTAKLVGAFLLGAAVALVGVLVGRRGR